MTLNPDEKKRHAKDLYLQKNYGITIEQFEEILEYQGGLCAICGKDITAPDARPNLDHDHRTKYLRGIVCNYCNHWVIGNLTLKQARAVAQYLEFPPAVMAGFSVVIPKKKRKKKRTLVSNTGSSVRKRTVRRGKPTST